MSRGSDFMAKSEGAKPEDSIYSFRGFRSFGYGMTVTDRVTVGLASLFCLYDDPSPHPSEEKGGGA